MKFDKQIQQQITGLFASYAKPDSPGFAVGIVHNNHIVFSDGFGQATLEHFSPITAETVFDVGSMAKQFVGMAIALLEEDHQLAISDKIPKYLPEFPDYAREVTLANLLYHTSGMRSYTVLAYYMMGYHESDAITQEEVYDLLLRLKSLNFKPGERWEYSDSNYFLLAKIIEKITAQSLNEFAQEAIFHPLGMLGTLFREQHSQVIRNRAIGYVPYPVAFQSPYLYRNQQEDSVTWHTLISNYEHVGAEGLFTSLEDLLKWDRNFSENRLGKGKSNLVERVLSPGAQINREIGYGFGLNIGKFRGKKFYGHDGAIHGYTSSMMLFPEQNLSIICLSNQNLAGSWEYRDRILDLIFPNNDFKTSPLKAVPQRKVDPQDQAIAGSYQNPETASIWEVVCQQSGFLIKENNNWEFELSQIEPCVYEIVQPPMIIKFKIDSAGKVREIKGVAGENTFTFIPFLQNPLRSDELVEYVGEYRSDELGITFDVEFAQQKLILKNHDRHFCSMDLMYSPTIRDSFIAYDPNPTSSQITFLREAGQITAFVYRDYDGDGREAIEFKKMSRQGSSPNR
jgi:CubicO group peptidase (beta-lactamase class C family)